MKQILYTVFALFLLAGCSNDPEPSRGPFEKTFYYITHAHEDIGVLKGKVKSIDFYYDYDPQEGRSPFRTVTYASDGRHLYERRNDYECDLFFYYDSGKKLYLRRYVDKNGNEESERFWYDAHGNPVKRLKYTLSPGQKPQYEEYEEISYTYYEEEEEGVYTALETFTIGADTLRKKRNDILNKAHFNRRAQPVYNGGLHFSYNRKGQLTRVVGSTAGNDIDTYEYKRGRLKKITLLRPSGESVSQKVLVYNTSGDRISEQVKGSSSRYEYEYEYDKPGNWVQKKKFYITEEGKELRESAMRIITYFADGETEEGIDESLLSVDEDILHIAENILQWAEEKESRQ